MAISVRAALSFAFLGALAGCGGSGSGDGDIPPIQPPGSTTPIGQRQMGEGTYYGATGAGACGSNTRHTTAAHADAKHTASVTIRRV